jgi:hypothetical protein
MIMASVSSSKSYAHANILAAVSNHILLGWVSRWMRMMRQVWIDTQELRITAHRRTPFVDC